MSLGLAAKCNIPCYGWWFFSLKSTVVWLTQLLSSLKSNSRPSQSWWLTVWDAGFSLPIQPNMCKDTHKYSIAQCIKHLLKHVFHFGGFFWWYLLTITSVHLLTHQLHFREFYPTSNTDAQRHTLSILSHWNLPKCPSMGNRLRKLYYNHIWNC